MIPIRILVADGHAVVRAGLKAMIGAQRSMQMVGEAADGPTAVRLTAKLNPDIVILEVDLPGMDGAEIAVRLRAARADQKVMVLTACEEVEAFRRLSEAGAVGYVLKRATAAEVVRAIRAVAAGGTYFDPILVARAADGRPRPAPDGNDGIGLSERESEIVRQIALGYSNKEIAAQLKLSVKTVETYKTRAMEKQGMRSRVDIVKHALRRGWLGGGADNPAPVNGDH